MCNQLDSDKDILILRSKDKRVEVLVEDGLIHVSVDGRCDYSGVIGPYHATVLPKPKKPEFRQRDSEVLDRLFYRG